MISERSCKIILLGDSGVGKTTLIHRYINQEFRADFKATIGVDFSSKTVIVGKRQVQLQMWDTAGEERFRSISPTFFRGTEACILVYDCTNRDSLNNLVVWRNDLIANVPQAAGKTFPFIVFANKSDLAAESGKVSKEEAEELLHFPVFEVSAKTGENIDDGFLKLSELYIEYAKESVHIVSLQGIDIGNEQNPGGADAKKCRC